MAPRTPRSLVTALLAALPFVGCAAGAVEPRVELDAGAPRPDVAPQQDVVSVDVAPQDAGDDAVTPTDVVAVDAGGCRGNRDGVITRDEFAVAVGASVIYIGNDPGTVVEPVDTHGQPAADGQRWDYSAPLSTDHRALDEVMSPRGRWWSSRYADATYAAIVDRTTNLLGVFRVSATALELLGTVSTEENRTDLRLTPPVIVLQFPLRVGATWEQTVTGAGTVNYTPVTNSNRYVNRVDLAGEVWTPAGRFPALRLNTALEQTVPLTVFRRTARTYTFLSECAGVVARVASTDNETTEEFRRASEFRRLGL